MQARRGYYAPRKPTDPTVQEKEEIQEAVFSQDETHELPIDVHTQYFMKTESDARIAVLTRIDLRPLHFRKEEDRNLDNLTFVTVVFDQDGHVVRASKSRWNCACVTAAWKNTCKRALPCGASLTSNPEPIWCVRWSGIPKAAKSPA